MRTLRFIVDDQIIKQDPNCDFSNLIPGSAGYIRAEFDFSPAWQGFVKVAGFAGRNHECEPQILEDGRSCVVPADALESRFFDIKIFGRKDDMRLTTNHVRVYQNGGKA
jgi:hypothetical protein